MSKTLLLASALVIAPVFGAVPSFACEAMVGAEYSDPPELVEPGLDLAVWHVALRTRDESRARKEYVLAGETLQDWTQRLTWDVTFGLRSWDLKAVRQAFLNDLSAQCSTLESRIIQAKPKDLVFEWWHKGCFGVPPQHEIERLIVGTIGTHRISYGVRDKSLAGKDRDQWLERISALELTGRVRGPDTPLLAGLRALWAGAYDEALKHLLPLAEKGDADAQAAVAGLQVEGWGVAKDYAKAIAWFQKAAAQNHARAWFSLGQMHEKGWGTEPDPARALEHYLKAAELGEAEAQGKVGYLFTTGEKPDYAKALAWFQRSAGAGHLHAAYWLGRLHEEGWGVQQQPPRASALYLDAARSGWPDAQFRLGRLYALGTGVEKSDERAKMWLVRAAMQGNEDARTFYMDQYKPKPDSPLTERVIQVP